MNEDTKTILLAIVAVLLFVGFAFWLVSANVNYVIEHEDNCIKNGYEGYKIIDNEPVCYKDNDWNKYEGKYNREYYPYN